MTILTARDDIRRLRGGGAVIGKIFSHMEKRIVPGVSTAELDREAEEIILANGAEPAFKGYRGYPATICASVNAVVVHGIPSESIILKDGDIVGIDVGVKKDGFFTDAARTFGVGTVTDRARWLMEVTKQCLDAGVKKAVSGNKVSDISNAVQKVAQKAGLEEVRAFVGHGIGKQLHESPEVPNWGEKGKGLLLEEGLVLAIEPMINLGTRKVQVLSDGWTAMTADRQLSAHFEHTILVGRKKTEIIA